MKAPAIPTRNPLAARHLAVQGPGISVEQQNIKERQQPAAMAGTLAPTVGSQAVSGARGEYLQQAQEVNTQQLGVNNALNSAQAGLATAPQGDYLRKQPNMTAAAELMTPEDKAQALIGLHKERVIEAAEQITGQPSKLRMVGSGQLIG
jgi:hypothetical protein